MQAPCWDIIDTAGSVTLDVHRDLNSDQEWCHPVHQDDTEPLEAEKLKKQQKTPPLQRTKTNKQKQTNKQKTNKQNKTISNFAVIFLLVDDPAPLGNS